MFELLNRDSTNHYKENYDWPRRQQNIIGDEIVRILIIDLSLFRIRIQKQCKWKGEFHCKTWCVCLRNKRACTAECQCIAYENPFNINPVDERDPPNRICITWMTS